VHPQLIQLVVEELQTNLTGRYLGKIFQLTKNSFAFDFGLRGRFLYLSVEPASPRLYLIQRRTRDLEKQSMALGSFGQLLKARVGGSAVTRIEKDPLDRIVRFSFGPQVLIVQLTGRAADLILLDSDTETKLRGTLPIGQIPAEKDFLPVTGSPSEYADAYFSSLDQAREFNSRANSVRAQLARSLRQKQKLKENLAQDLATRGDPEEHKRIGDLLLANLSTAKRAGNKVTLLDYFADDSPSLEIEVDENTSLQDEAAHRFRQYTKAKHAREEIASRMVQLDHELAQLNGRLAEIERIIGDKDETGLESFVEKKPAPKTKTKQPQKISGVRRYLSGDGYEILVGRAAKDNDHLTFKVAQPNDLWLHAGDYPGSHVVVRNPTRKEIPHRTVIEAAQLAGRFSQASEDTKVIIHYTQRKFLSKPKGAAPGLVRLSRFRSITVEPKESVSRIID
jgi:predicted ribosome quality control (RQC) complex YloA/Tae2 family protein